MRIPLMGVASMARFLAGLAACCMVLAGCATAPSPRCVVENPPPSDGRIGLDVPEERYRAYFVQVRKRIIAKWVYPKSAGEQGIEGQVLLDFDIAKDGRLEYTSVVQSSGTQILDEAVLVAVKLGQPFPPVPDSVSNGALRLRGAFCYRIVKGVVDRTLK